MDLDTLRFANFSKLQEAIADWEHMTKRLLDLKHDAEHNLKAKADKANWAGLNATVTREFVDKTAGEFGDAHRQADSVTKILKDTHGELVGYHDQLNATLEREPNNHLTVIDTGHGTFTVTGSTRPDWASDPSGNTSAYSQKDIDALRDDIQRILSKATESDNSAAKVLKLLVDQAKYGFSDAHYTDRDSAAKAVEEADKVAKILKKDPSEVSDTELNELNSALAQYKNDPLFAERFATDVGPKRTLEFYSGIVDDSQFAVNPRSGHGLTEAQQKRMQLAEGLEKQLGMTLATASHSDSSAMQSWKSQVINLGGTDLRPDGENPVYGFQVMSNLMRNGEYKTDFLHDYGNHLIAYEKSHTSDEYGGLQHRVTRKGVLPWDHSGEWEQLHYGDTNDAGRDPMTGFMEALGHNSEASTQFFNEGDHFKYLAEQRDWPQDFAGDHAKTIAGYTSLGHALESATTGAPYDAHPPQLHRDLDTAKVAEKVVHLYGQPAEGNDKERTQLSGAELMKKQDGIQDSLSRIGSAYIDDLNWSMDDDDKRSVFAQDGTGRSMGERAHLQASDTRGFLGTLGQDPKAYAQIGAAQQVYTTSVLDAHQPTVDSHGVVHSAAAETAVRTGAEVQGIIDQSRADQSTAEGAAKEAAYNAAVDQRIGRQKEIAGAIVGGAFSLIPEPESGLASTIVPIATESTQDQVTSHIEENLDKYGESQHRQLADVRQGDRKAIYDAGFTSSWEPGRHALERLNGSTWHGDAYYQVRENLKNAQATGYTAGSNAQQEAGNLPVTE
ncbi:hypothetical protein [Streptomyces sp. NPDC046942]|uniref:hypothetical protein n=1 Tax=Streptomyces sp. NPDC046942 TaxID=3155137 RepID=UPI0033BFB93A